MQEHVKNMRSTCVLEYKSISGYRVLHSHNVIIKSQVYHIRCQVIACQVSGDNKQVSGDNRQVSSDR